jgi:hypothetical protein
VAVEIALNLGHSLSPLIHDRNASLIGSIVGPLRPYCGAYWRADRADNHSAFNTTTVHCFYIPPAVILAYGGANSASASVLVDRLCVSSYIAAYFYHGAIVVSAKHVSWRGRALWPTQCIHTLSRSGAEDREFVPTTAAIKTFVQKLCRIHSEFIGPWYTAIVIAIHRGLCEKSWR